MTTELAFLEVLKSEVAALVAPTLGIKVQDFQSCETAATVGLQVKDYLKQVEAKRKELVEPLNRRVKEINEYAKSILAPLEESETHLKRQIATFREAQEKIQREMLRAAEIERLKQEAELRAKQEAERASLEETLVEEDRLAKRFGAEPDQAANQEAQIAELEQRQAEEQAFALMEQKQREHDIAQQNIKNTRKTWKCEATDLEKVPRQYLVITLNSAACLAAARGGITEIPGVRMWQETTVAFGSNTYVPRAALMGRKPDGAA